MKTLFLCLVKEDLATLLAGLTPFEWLLRGAAGYPHCVIDAVEQATLPADAAGVAILYPDTPLVRGDDLAELLREMNKRGSDGYEIGRGSLRTAAAFRRGDLPKRRCLAPFAERLTDNVSRARIEKTLYRRNAEISARNGVMISDVDTVRIDATSQVEAGATIEPYTHVARSVVKAGARIGAFSEIEDSVIGENATISRSVVRESVVGKDATVGPFAYLRAGSSVGDGVRIGDFVEVKKSTLGAGVKAAHLAYIGDATVGAGTNVGCGTVFANYDGKVKHRTKVGEKVFLGANSNLIAPVTIGDGAFIAAATTVTKDVPPAAFAIGRVREEIKEKRRARPSEE